MHKATTLPYHKGNELYFFRFNRDQPNKLHVLLADFMSRKDLSLDWRDAARLSAWVRKVAA